MISVHEALKALFALVSPLDAETVPLLKATGRILREPAVAGRDQPPFAASAMDGYAMQAASALPGAILEVIGEAAAGRRYGGVLGPGEAVRIFTGAPLPEGADHIEIQEDVEAHGGRIRLTTPEPSGRFIRPAGGDFKAGAKVEAPRLLGPADIALLAAMNIAKVQVARKPNIALISTGDELVMPGEAPSDDQIIASNGLGLHALLSAHGAEARLLPIARDTKESLVSAFRFARGADLIVTIGGASVGDHDLVRQVAGDAGMEQSFYKVAMRPGKPLMAGRLGATPIVGLPGNPVSALVCGHVFLLPMLRKMLGLPAGGAPRRRAPLAHDIGPNGPREHYMRAVWKGDALSIFDRQDSSLLSLLAGAHALAIRPAHDGPRAAGEPIDYLPLGAPVDTKSEHP
ncbi:MAG: gephyrin-like molybdotransferase Glp, partial [Pseudomonadota bacterium]